MENKSNPRLIGSLLVKRNQQPDAPVPPPSAPATQPDAILADALNRQSESIAQLAQAITAQNKIAPNVVVEMQPAPARSYLITVERGTDKLPKGYLIEPLSKT